MLSEVFPWKLTAHIVNPAAPGDIIAFAARTKGLVSGGAEPCLRVAGVVGHAADILGFEAGDTGTQVWSSSKGWEQQQCHSEGRCHCSAGQEKHYREAIIAWITTLDLSYGLSFEMPPAAYGKSNYAFIDYPLSP